VVPFRVQSRNVDEMKNTRISRWEACRGEALAWTILTGEQAGVPKRHWHGHES